MPQWYTLDAFIDSEKDDQERINMMSRKYTGKSISSPGKNISQT